MGPFERHLREAIELNEHRRGLYAELSGGDSLAVSRGLLRSERLLLPVARWFDHRAAPYHRVGVPLLEELFVPMRDTPAFGAGAGCRPGPRLARPPVRAIRRRMLGALRRQGFGGTEVVVEEELRRLADAPCAHCMLRHLLESAHRLCALAPGLHRAAHARGLRSPDRLLALLLRLHAWGLGAAARLDRQAFPLQRRGIPILCQDVPPVSRPRASA